MTTGLDSLLQRRDALLDAWVSKQRQIARLQAEAAELLAERWELFEEENATAPGHQGVIERSMLAEYSAAGHVSKGAMEYSFADARMLAQFPATRAAFQDGRVTPGHVRHLLAESHPVREAIDTGEVAPETLGLYEQAVLEVAEHDTAARTRTHARQVAAALAGATVVEQHTKAFDERTVTIRSVGDGLALLQAVLPEVLAVAIHDRLTRMARHLSGHPEDRSPALPPFVPFEAEWAAWEAEFTAADRAERALFAEIARGDALTSQEDEGRSTAAGQATAMAGPAGTTAGADDTMNSIGGSNSDVDDTSDHFDDYLNHRLDADGYWPDEDDPDPGGPRPEPDLDYWTDPNVDPDSPCIIHLSDDPRTYDQLRADLLADLLLTTNPSDAHGTALGSIRATVQVTVAATTLLGDDGRPAELDGHGPIRPDTARTLAGANSGWTRLFLNPGGMVTETDTYTPTEPMRRFLRARDQHCRFPGCRQPVHRCESDHNLDWALGGQTSTDNLAYFCKTHHGLKHPDLPDFARWTARQTEDQTVEWISPTGRPHPDPVPRRVMFIPSETEPAGLWHRPQTAQEAGSPF
ncbi:MAG: hypothetical protein BGN97_10175 [Microbacterium sp. 69-10]|uniref:HNH endonuclease signature motif containing protein n=1 Tax=Microbacterium sp. 69-10 TaxID=1895783 RepID=UPI00095B6D48|nr:HNH endonuclease signature motif containing protein [Microbacterium sp. 69-10]OJU41526.1 MAG: hypothetical protein BGN97_10175 [Microbacterium sp. 69-10]